MKRSVFIFFYLNLVVSAPLNAQTTPLVNGVDFYLENDRIVVKYNLNDSHPEARYAINLRFVTDRGEALVPQILSGDVGKGIEPGAGKTIRWDYQADLRDFSGNLKAVVSASPDFSHAGGPSNAFLSLAVPGLGGFFVGEDRIRPVATTAVSLGLLGYGLLSKSRSNKFYDDYLQGGSFEEISNTYDKANAAHHRYLIATGLAIAVWANDIIWVARRGKQNQEIRKSALSGTQGSGMILNRTNGDWLIGYRITF